MSLATIARENVGHLQSLMDGHFDVLALTDYESFEQLVFTPIMDMSIPRLVLVPQTGDPHLVCQAIGYEQLLEETHLPATNVHAYYPYDVSAGGDDGPTFEQAVDDALSDGSTGRVGVDHDHATVADVETVRRTVSTDTADCSDFLRTVFQRRRPEEVELIRRAAEVAEAGVEAALDAVEPGTTEYELASVAERTMTAMGARARPYDLHVTSGSHSLHPVRRLSRKPIEAGDSLVLDFLPKVDHYFGDIARTTVVGADPTAEQRELQEVVLAALERVESELRPGIRASEVDAVLREFLAREGYDGDCITHTGHAIGNDWGPRITSADDTELTAGMVVAVEPGLYVEGVGGVRIEDAFLLTDGGAESLMSLPRDPLDLP
ncbi:MAG: M24 family metallopeptidase [Haloarculaceae archaeon]